jgi:hypothetical protein
VTEEMDQLDQQFHSQRFGMLLALMETEAPVPEFPLISQARELRSRGVSPRLSSGCHANMAG